MQKQEVTLLITQIIVFHMATPMQLSKWPIVGMQFIGSLVQELRQEFGIPV